MTLLRTRRCNCWKGFFRLLLLLTIFHKESDSLLTRVKLNSASSWRVTCHLASSSSSVHDEQSSAAATGPSRRTFVHHSMIFLSSIVLPAQADDDIPAGLVSRKQVADLLHVVPTFTLVDKRGVPYMVVGEDARVTGYFFTEYSEAKRILDLARVSADKAIQESKKDPKQNPDDLVNPWKEARVSTIPLDVAVTLVTRSMYVSAKGGGNFFQVSPSVDDIEDALAITGKDDLAEGKVPLFYYEDFTIQKNGNKQSPLYFRKSELEGAFQRANPGQELPKEVSVTELFAVLTEMVKPGGTDKDLQTLVFVPPAESAQKAKECQRKGGDEAPLLLGERNLVL